MKGILPGALVEVESRYEAGRGMIVTRIEEVLAPGGGTPVAEARAYHERGLGAEALALLGEGALADPAALATRARLRIDAGRTAEAAADVRALLESGDGDAMEPWDVASLLGALDAAPREALLPALAAWLAKTTLPPGAAAVQRAMRLVPSSACTIPQLFAHLANSDASEVLSAVVAELRARGIDDARVAAADAALAGVREKENEAAAAKRAHGILRAALRAAQKKVKPSPPYHLGGPAPKLTVRDLVLVSTFFVRRVREHVRPEEREAFERTLAILERPMTALAMFEDWTPDASPAMRVLEQVSLAVREGSPYALQRCGQRAAAAAVKILQFAKRPDEASALVRDLDALLVAREWEALRASHPDGAPDVASLLWRGADEKNTLAHVLVRTKDGGIALLSKAGRRWRWHTGSRDDVLATIPDAHFAEATRRA